MNNKHFFFGLIPAKKKSKRLKNKNLLKINNKTILEIAIRESLSSKLISETYVSTNSKKIYNISLKSNSKAVLRLKKYSSNNASSSDVIIDFINQLGLKKKKNSYIVYLQPTSPLRNRKHIDKAIKSFLKNKKSSLISFKSSKKNNLKDYYVKNEKLLPLYPNALVANIENLPKVYSPNGAIFIFKVTDFVKKKNLVFKDFHPFIMDYVSSIDIDYKEDYLLAKNLLK